MLTVYSTVGWFAIATVWVVMVVSPLIKNLMHLDTIKDDDLAGGAIWA